MGSSRTAGWAAPRNTSVVVVSEEDVDRSEGMLSEVASEGATVVVAAKSVGIDAGVLHLSGSNTVSAVDVDVGGVGVSGVGVMHLTWLSNWGSWILRAHGVESSLANDGKLLWGVDVVSRVGDGGGGVLHPVELSRSDGTWLAPNSAASTCDAAC